MLESLTADRVSPTLYNVVWHKSSLLDARYCDGALQSYAHRDPCSCSSYGTYRPQPRPNTPAEHPVRWHSDVDGGF